MIYTVTLNPSLDYFLDVDNYQLDKINRSYNEEFIIGGKGLNMSIVLTRLNVDNTALGYIAGFTGKYLLDELAKQNINHDFIELDDGMTRINIKVRSGVETDINAQGPVVSDDVFARLLKQIEVLDENDILILGGSIPLGISQDAYDIILDLATKNNVLCVIDTTGKKLINALKYRPFLIKPNVQEVEESLQVKVNCVEDIITYAKQLQTLGAQNVLVSRGKYGSLLLTQDGEIIEMGVADGEVLSSIGAGDSMIAGFMAKYLETKDFKDALIFGTACGGATAFTKGIATSAKILAVYDSLKK